MKPNRICIQCRLTEKEIRRDRLDCVGPHNTWKRHKFYKGTYTLGEHSKKAALNEDQRRGKILVQRHAYREGQLDVLKRINSIINAGLNDYPIIVAELQDYCNNLEGDVNRDKEITNRIINNKKLT